MYQCLQVIKMQYFHELYIMQSFAEFGIASLQVSEAVVTGWLFFRYLVIGGMLQPCNCHHYILLQPNLKSYSY